MVFQHGEVYQYEQHKGFINFIGSEYITLCIRQSLKEERLRRNSKCNYVQVNLCIYAHYWDKLIKIDETLPNEFPWPILLHWYYSQRNSFYHFPQTFPQETNTLWKTRKRFKYVNKSKCVFYLSVNISTNCSLSTSPNECQCPNNQHLKCVTNPLTNPRR